ncbi:hypothetical protein Nepgr_025126 [Nepenthes gracilis]|uniref:RING-type domain-containing protein n=1 Tax=Nepenthes gracilis TaxID=150966 RepID=A0AAD3T459_NEPGR|nr:hypothetical protein Nepgr_025126 [Nepenthes gracilis]
MPWKMEKANPSASDQGLRRKTAPQAFHWMEKSQPSASSLKQLRKSTTHRKSKNLSKMSAPKHHIRWKVCADSNNTVGKECCLCQKDLAVAPSGGKPAFGILPVASIMPCGHAFHHDCLEIGGLNQQPGDPPCVLCTSSDS